MIFSLLLALWFQVSLMSTAAPLQQPWLLNQNQYSDQIPQELLQQQLLELQQFQMLKRLYPSDPMNFQQLPIVILLNTPSNFITNDVDQNMDKLGNHKEENLKPYSGDSNSEDEDLDSVIVEAAAKKSDEKFQQPPRAIILVPNGGRFSLGSIISGIPWLPFEVNVPDTASWIYNGISNIISGIGNRFPFRPRPSQNMTSPNENLLKFLFKNYPNRRTQTALNSPPMLVVPIYDPVIPIQF